MRRLVRQPQALVGRLSEVSGISGWKAFSTDDISSEAGTAGRGRAFTEQVPQAPGAPQGRGQGPLQQAPGSPPIPQGRGRGQIYVAGRRRPPQQPGDRRNRMDRDMRLPVRSPFRQPQQGAPPGDDRFQQFRPRSARRPLPRSPGPPGRRPNDLGLAGAELPADLDADVVLEGEAQRRPRRRLVGGVRGAEGPRDRGLSPRGRSESYRESGGSEQGQMRAGRGSDQLMDTRRQRAGPGRGAVSDGRRTQARAPARRPRFRQDNEDPKAAALLDELGKYELDPGEPMAFIDRRTHARIRDVRDMPRTEQQRDMDFVRSIMLDLDLETNVNLGTPRRAKQRPPEETAEGMKANFMKMMGIETEEEWQEVKEGALEGFDESFKLLQKEFRARDVKAEEAELEQMVRECSLTPEHPLFPTLETSMQQLLRNPFWPFEQKVKYVKRLINTLSSTPLGSLRASSNA